MYFIQRFIQKKKYITKTNTMRSAAYTTSSTLLSSENINSIKKNIIFIIIVVAFVSRFYLTFWVGGTQFFFLNKIYFVSLHFFFRVYLYFIHPTVGWFFSALFLAIFLVGFLLISYFLLSLCQNIISALFFTVACHHCM